MKRNYPWYIIAKLLYAQKENKVWNAAKNVTSHKQRTIHLNNSLRGILKVRIDISHLYTNF